MTTLSIFDAHNPKSAPTVTHDSGEIGELLNSKGVRLSVGQPRTYQQMQRQNRFWKPIALRLQS